MAHNSKLRPFSLKAGKAVFITIPICCEWMSTWFSSIHSGTIWFCTHYL